MALLVAHLSCARTAVRPADRDGPPAPRSDLSIAGDAGDGNADASCVATGPCDFAPSNLGDMPPFAEDGVDLRVGSDNFRFWRIDTGSGEIIAYDGPDPATADSRTIRQAGEGTRDGIELTVVDQGPATPSLAVFKLRELRVNANAELVAHGPRPLVMTAAQDIQVIGLVDASADTLPDRSEPGAGGARGNRNLVGAGDGGGGQGGRLSTPKFRGGGGGGSFGGLGGSGSGSNNTGGTPGPRYGNMELIPLLAGSAGGAGAVDDDQGSGRGGHGGGAVQFVSRTLIVLAATGRINAGGGGGAAGNPSLTSEGGGGGGSGGAILLEAPQVVLSGQIGANGGSGGENLATAGQTGDPVQIPAPADKAGLGSGNNGLGGNAEQATEPGGHGGGGGGGRIRINTLSGAEVFGSGITPRGALLSVGKLSL